jgi:hypothetical protein
MDELKIKRFLTTVKPDTALCLCNLTKAWLNLSMSLAKVGLAGESTD